MTLVDLVMLLEAIERDQLENFLVFLDCHLLKASLSFYFLRVLAETA